MSNKLPPLSLPYTKVHTVLHRGKAYARYVDDADPLLHVLASSHGSSPRLAAPSRQLDAFASEWAVSPPERKREIALRALEPRFLAADVAKNACALSMRRPTALVDQNLESLRGLIRADTFTDGGELRTALTLKGAAGLNTFIMLVSRQAQPVRGLYYGCRFVSRVASAIAERQSDEAVNALVSKVDAACDARLQAKVA